MNHRLDPLYDHRKPPPKFRFKFSLGAVIVLGALTGVMFAQYGKNAYWYLVASVIIIIAIIMGETFR